MRRGDTHPSECRIKPLRIPSLNTRACTTDAAHDNNRLVRHHRPPHIDNDRRDTDNINNCADHHHRYRPVTHDKHTPAPDCPTDHLGEPHGERREQWFDPHRPGTDGA